ncbi:MAG: hypothetical protein R2777_10355 [Chitinophagales bacterium]
MLSISHKIKKSITLCAMSVKVSNLTKQYGEQLAVNHISFELNKGEVFGFLSQWCRQIYHHENDNRYIEPTEGTIEVCGINQQENPLQAKEKIGYLPENNPLYYDMYVKEYLGFVANLYKIKQKRTHSSTYRKNRFRA